MDINDIYEKIKNISESYDIEPIGGWITGDGPIPCKIMFIGEAPGKTEVEEQKPFVGTAGKTFEGYLNSIGLSKSDVRISNACFFRPVKVSIGQNEKKTLSNRPPKPSEVNLFKEVLDSEINLVNPSIIVTLGNIPLKRLTKLKSIGECHGELYFNDDLNRNIFPMYHPSSLIYNRDESFLKMFENDWQKLKAVLAT